jgi:hypothetical protein
VSTHGRAQLASVGSAAARPRGALASRATLRARPALGDSRAVLASAAHVLLLLRTRLLARALFVWRTSVLRRDAATSRARLASHRAVWSAEQARATLRGQCAVLRLVLRRRSQRMRRADLALAFERWHSLAAQCRAYAEATRIGGRLLEALAAAREERGRYLLARNATTSSAASSAGLDGDVHIPAAPFPSDVAWTTLSAGDDDGSSASLADSLRVRVLRTPRAHPGT